MNINSISLENFVNGRIYRGIITGLNEAFIIDNATKTCLLTKEPDSSHIIKPFLIGKDIKRYENPNNQLNIIFMPKGWTRHNSNGISNSWKWLQQNYKVIANHLEPFSQAAIKRFDKGEYWWELRACDYYHEFEKPKIIYPNICKKPEFTLDLNNLYSNQKCYIIPCNDLYLLGILNSQIMMFFFRIAIPKLRGDFFEPGFAFMRDFPVHNIDHTCALDVKRHDRMVALVEHMLELHKRTPQTPQEQESLTRQIQSADREIDSLVYELYGLTEEEIKIVEGG